MAKKSQKSKSSTAASQFTGSVKDSAQQILQAGKDALAKAQAGVESLVKDSVSIKKKTQAAAEEKISEASSKVTTMATDISSKASGQWDKLENIFEDRVAKALNRLGVPSAKDVSALSQRIDDLNKAVQKLSAKAPAAKAEPAKKRAAPARKAPAAAPSESAPEAQAQ